MITLIAAISENGIIGDSTLDTMPWHCKEELKVFRATTMGGTLIMGRKTAEQVGKLPGRDAIVLSNRDGYQLPGFTTMTIDQLLFANMTRSDHNFYLCGGGEIYKELAPECDNMIISYMKFECGGDVAFPDIDWDVWTISNYTKHDQFDTYYYYRK